MNRFGQPPGGGGEGGGGGRLDVLKATVSVNVNLIKATPFYAATIVLAAVSWVIAFISACVAAGLRNAAEDDALPSRGGAARRAPDPVLLVPPLSPLTWFVIVFNLFLLAGYVVAAGGPGRLDKYRRILHAFSTANIVFLTLEASAYVQRQLPSQLGLAAGLIMLDMIYFLWIIAVGAEDGTLAKRLTVEAELPALRPARQNGIADGGGGAGDGGEAGSTGGGRSPARAAPTPAPMAAPAVAVPAVAKAAKRPVSMANSVETTMTEYALKAQALYPYSASADDPNELTFEQDEILEIADSNGKWWQARNSRGEVGIAPSNYLKLLT